MLPLRLRPLADSEGPAGEGGPPPPQTPRKGGHRSPKLQTRHHTTSGWGRHPSGHLLRVGSGSDLEWPRHGSECGGARDPPRAAPTFEGQAKKRYLPRHHHLIEAAGLPATIGPSRAPAIPKILLVRSNFDVAWSNFNLGLRTAGSEFNYSHTSRSARCA